MVVASSPTEPVVSRDKYAQYRKPPRKTDPPGTLGALRPVAFRRSEEERDLTDNPKTRAEGLKMKHRRLRLRNEAIYHGLLKPLAGGLTADDIDGTDFKSKEKKRLGSIAYVKNDLASHQAKRRCGTKTADPATEDPDAILLKRSEVD